MSNSRTLKIDDVRAIIADKDIDPLKTNGNILRKLLGRGSLGTIQKHLDTIRAEIEEGDKPESSAITPDDSALKAIWDNVATLVHQKALETITALYAEKDRLNESITDLRYNLFQVSENLKGREEQRDKLAEDNEALKTELKEVRLENITLKNIIEHNIGRADDDKEEQAAPGRKQRTKITPEIEAEVKKGFDAGKKAADIAKSVSISIGSVNKIKTKLTKAS